MSNPLIGSLLQKSQARFSVDRASMSYTDWIIENTTLRGRPFSVGDYHFQRQIIDDTHPNMDVIKCSQVGLTEGQIRKALAFLMRNRGVSAIFTLPNQAMYERISNARIKPIVEKDSVFNPPTSTKPTRTKSMMQFGDSWLYITGCTEGDATSISADAVFNDELDLSPQNMIALFGSRLQNSLWKINQRFGTPSFPEFGIDAGYKTSDQHQYLARCGSCNHWNWPEFNRDFIVVPGLPDSVEHLADISQEHVDMIDVMGSYVACEKCGTELDLGNKDGREWVPKHPNRKHARGYHVTPFTTDRLPPSYIIGQLLKYRERDYMRGFYNTVLGVGYIDGNIRLGEEDINRCFTGQVTEPKIDPRDPVWVGIDMGQTCHLTLGQGDSPEAMHVFRFATCHVDEVVYQVKQICEQFRVIGGSCDRHPYEPVADEIMRVSDGKIVPAEYRGTKEVNLVFEVDETLSHAQVDRTKMIDEVVRYVRHQTKHLRFSGYSHQKTVISEHLRAMVRDEKPEEPAKWVKLSDSDHFFHALGFLLVAMKIKEVQRIKNKEDPRSVVMGGLVTTGAASTGPSAFKNKGWTRRR